MKTTEMLILTIFLLVISACSKQENDDATHQGSIAEMSAMEKPIEAMPSITLPNEIDASDMSGKNVEQDASGKKVIYWVDPMVPDRHFSKSGQSPFMDMQLVPRYAE